MADRFTGTFLVHCHIAEHSDTGMIMVGEIVNEGRPQFHLARYNAEIFIFVKFYSISLHGWFEHVL